MSQRTQLAELRNLAAAMPWGAATVWWGFYILTPITVVHSFFHGDARFSMAADTAVAETRLVLAAASLTGFAVAFVLAAKARRLSLMVESHIRSAAQGYTVIRGHAAGAGQLLSTPHGARPCYWYDYEVSRETLRNGRTEYKTIRCEQQGVAFLLEDADGVCLIDPRHARVTAWHNDSVQVGDRRFEERYIAAGDELHVMGEFTTRYDDWPGSTPTDLLAAAEWVGSSGKARPGEGISVMAKPAGRRELLISAEAPALMGKTLGRIAGVQSGLAALYLLSWLAVYLQHGGG